LITGRYLEYLKQNFLVGVFPVPRACVLLFQVVNAASIVSWVSMVV